MIKPGVIVGVAAIVLAVVGFVGPWWTIGATASGSATFTSVTDFRLFGRTGTGTEPGRSYTNSTDYSGDPNTRFVFQVASALTGAAVGLGVIYVVPGAMADKKPTFRRVAFVFGVLAFAVAFVASVYVMATLPGAVNQDRSSSGIQFSGFWGSSTSTGFGMTLTINWGAGWGWYVVLASAVLFLVGAILTVRAPNRASMAPPRSPETPL